MARQRALGDIPGRTGPGRARPGQLERAGSAPPAATGSAGVIAGRRPGRATPRTVLGGMLVAAAVIVVFAIAFSAAHQDQSSYAVAAHELQAGSIIGPGDLTTAPMGLSGATRSSAFGSPAPLVGRTLAVSVGPGQLIETPMLSARSGSGLRPVSVAVDSNSLDALSPGNAVDVLAFASSSSGSGNSASSGATVVLRGATLISVDRNTSGLLGASSAGSSVVVTLGVSELSQAEAVVAAAHSGTIELILAEPADGTGAGGSS